MLVTNRIRPRRPATDVLTEEYWRYLNFLWSDEPSARPEADEVHVSLLSLRNAALLSLDAIPGIQNDMSRSQPAPALFPSLLFV